jgi:hypothetical protein
MSISSLLARLKNDASIVVSEERKLPDGTVIYILEAPVTFYPHAPHHLWYNLVVANGQTRVEKEEIEAILRHFWHAEIDIDTWVDDPPNTAG